MAPGNMSLKIPKPARSTDFGSNCQAMAVLGCSIARGVEENTCAETGLNGGVQWLIHIMRDGIERAAQTGDMLMRIQWIGIQCVSYPEGPGEFLGHLPSVLCVEIEIEKVERLVR